MNSQRPGGARNEVAEDLLCPLYSLFLLPFLRELPSGKQNPELSLLIREITVKHCKEIRQVSERVHKGNQI